MTLGNLAAQNSRKKLVRREKIQETNRDGWRVTEVENQTAVRCLQEVCEIISAER